MSVSLKSHVLRRDEKGFLGIPFKRLLMAGTVGGLSFSFIKGGAGELPAFIIAVILTVFTLIMTALKGGLPRYQRIMYGVRGNLMVAANTNPHGFAAQICNMMELQYEKLVVLDGDYLFKTPAAQVESDDALMEWTFYTTSDLNSGGTNLAKMPVISLARLPTLVVSPSASEAVSLGAENGSK